MLTIISAPDNQALADRIQQDLESKNHVFSSKLQPGTSNILISLLSLSAVNSSVVQTTIIEALDNGQHIIPVLVENMPLPKLIDHLEPVSLFDGYNLVELEKRILQHLSSSNATLPLKVLTPTVIRKNRNYGYWLALIVIIWFIFGVILVGFFGIQAPRDEYNNVNTQAAATIQGYLRRNQPHTTEDAVNFPATVQAAPTAQRPFLIATATASVSLE